MVAAASESDCSAAEINAWDTAVVLEDQGILETTDADAPVTLARRSEENMFSDQPGQNLGLFLPNWPKVPR